MKRHELRTPRLLLRAWRDADLDSYARLNADPRAMEWFPGPLDRQQSSDSMAHFDAIHVDLGYTAWAVEVMHSECGSADFVGFVGLVPPSFEPPFPVLDPCVEIGWRLDPAWWGMGIATEAALVALRWGLLERQLPEVVSFTVPPNLRSQAVMQRIGMRYDGTFEHPRGPGTWWGAHVLYRARPSDLRPT